MFIYLNLKNYNANILEVTKQATSERVNFKLYNQKMEPKGV